ncbi:MAG: hypothetical protein SF028_12685 [Candidatus Sumerlaeia bacterium]|nr:hypothetical protein [Candidatus Sumerlaeia bacterium]
MALYPQIGLILELLERVTGVAPKVKAPPLPAPVPASLPLPARRHTHPSGAPVAPARDMALAALAQPVRAYFAAAAWDGAVRTPAPVAPPPVAAPVPAAAVAATAKPRGDARIAEYSVRQFFAIAAWDGAAAPQATAPAAAGAAPARAADPDNVSAENLFGSFGFD